MTINLMLKLRNYIGAVILGLLVATTASAQSLGIDEPIRVSISPQVPAPGQTVTITVSGIGTFLGDATVTWRRDSAVVQSGVGERTYSFVAGPLGQLTRIGLTIDSPTQGVITRTFTFVPATVHLVWEVDTSVPPLYRGKALYSPGSTIRVIAFPQVVSNGAALSAVSLSYQWKRGGEPVPSSSGKGRNTFTFTGNQFQGGESVSVEAYLDDALVAQSSILIPAVQPQILLYQRDPLRGVIWSEAMPAAISLNTKEITVQAVPYFFASDSLTNGELIFEWTLNSRSTTGPDAEAGLMTLRQTGEGRGQALLGVSLQNTSGVRLLQSAEAAVRMVFGEQTNGLSSFFGL